MCCWETTNLGSLMWAETMAIHEERRIQNNGLILMLMKNKWGLYRINRYKPRITCTCVTAPVPALPPFLLSQESTWVQADTSDANLLCQPRPHILLRNPQSTECLSAEAMGGQPNLGLRCRLWRRRIQTNIVKVHCT